MSNAPVPAAATGLPKSTRRAFMASAAALSAAAPVSIGLAASAARDPVFAAIADWHRVDAEWLAKLEIYGEAESACKAENALFGARIDVEICGVPFSFKTNEEISYFLNTLPNRGASATENVEQMQQAGQRFRDALEGERKRVEQVRSQHAIDLLDAQAQTASDVATAALVRVVETVPTTLPGIRALAEFMAEPERVHDNLFETGLASLAEACRAVLPAA